MTDALSIIPTLTLFLTPAFNMESLNTCGPPSPAAVYTDLSTAIASIQAHAKDNGYALFKRDTTKNRIVYTCDRYGKPQAKPKNTQVHESKRRHNTTYFQLLRIY